MIEALGARVHLFVRLAYREPFTALFRDTLQCEVRELDFGMSEPILLVRFPDGSAFSVEFSDLAPEPSASIDDERAFRGAWIEFRARDVDAVHRRLHEAGISSFSHPPSQHRYFSAPGGQVFRILDVDYSGP
ncbi:MAG TPA: hypothetical protein VGG70_05430 [Candidatus Cybelea sp.]|jgi:hypothetical protein